MQKQEWRGNQASCVAELSILPRPPGREKFLESMLIFNGDVSFSPNATCLLRGNEMT